ncbi:MAG: hypothetical protein K0V04_12005, partial [Deltaproteobacteria bacterium]|nr:hypothetical protein [Deltaproteobacteria bacterium]
VAQRSFGTGLVEGLEFRYAVQSAAHNGNAVVFTVWGPAAHGGMDEALTAALDGVGYPTVLVPTEVADGRFVDHQYGVSMAELSGWTRSDKTPAGLPIGRFIEWTKGGAEVGLLMVSADTFSEDGDWVASFAEQSMRDLLAHKQALGKPESSQDVLDGHPSRRLVYADAQVEVAVRNSVLYMFIAANTDAATVAGFRGSVRWKR